MHQPMGIEGVPRLPFSVRWYSRPSAAAMVSMFVVHLPDAVLGQVVLRHQHRPAARRLALRPRGIELKRTVADRHVRSALRTTPAHARSGASPGSTTGRRRRTRCRCAWLRPLTGDRGPKTELQRRYVRRDDAVARRADDRASAAWQGRREADLRALQPQHAQAAHEFLAVRACAPAVPACRQRRPPIPAGSSRRTPRGRRRLALRVTATSTAGTASHRRQLLPHAVHVCMREIVAGDGRIPAVRIPGIGPWTKTERR